MYSVRRTSLLFISLASFSIATGFGGARLTRDERTEPKTFETVEKHILSVTSDAAAGIYDFRAVFDEATRDLKKLYYSHPTDGEEHFTIAQIERGVTLVKIRRGPFSKPAVKAVGRMEGNTGVFNVTLGLLREYGIIRRDDLRRFQIQFLYENGEWVVYTNESAGRNRFNELYLKARRDSDGDAIGVELAAFGLDGRVVEEHSTEKMPKY